MSRGCDRIEARPRRRLSVEKPRVRALFRRRGDFLRLNVKNERAKERREDAESDGERPSRFFRFEHRFVIVRSTVGEESASEKINGEKRARGANEKFDGDSKRVTSGATARKGNARRFRNEDRAPNVDGATNGG